MKASQAYSTSMLTCYAKMRSLLPHCLPIIPQKPYFVNSLFVFSKNNLMLGINHFMEHDLSPLSTDRTRFNCLSFKDFDRTHRTGFLCSYTKSSSVLTRLFLLEKHQATTCEYILSEQIKGRSVFHTRNRYDFPSSAFMVIK